MATGFVFPSMWSYLAAPLHLWLSINRRFPLFCQRRITGGLFLPFLLELISLRIPWDIPIHIFGCFDPQTIPYLFFSGADIFDGLSWMRYYFRDGHSFYYREFEYDTRLQN